MKSRKTPTRKQVVVDDDEEEISLVATGKNRLFLYLVLLAIILCVVAIFLFSWTNKTENGKMMMDGHYSSTVAIDKRRQIDSSSSQQEVVKEEGKFQEFVTAAGSSGDLLQEEGILTTNIVPIIVDDQEVQILLDSNPTLASVHEAAEKFIRQHTLQTEDEQANSANTYSLFTHMLKSLRAKQINVFDSSKTSTIFIVINSENYPVEVAINDDGTHSLFADGLTALCTEFADEFGISHETHQECVSQLSYQIAPIIEKQNAEILASETETMSYYDVPINFANS